MIGIEAHKIVVSVEQGKWQEVDWHKGFHSMHLGNQQDLVYRKFPDCKVVRGRGKRRVPS